MTMSCLVAGTSGPSAASAQGEVRVSSAASGPEGSARPASNSRSTPVAVRLGACPAPVCPGQRLEDYAHYRRGEAGAVSPATAEITGTAPRSIEQFARDYAAAFTGESSG